MTVCLLTGLHRYYWLDLLEKKQNIGLVPSQMTLNFESHLDHHIDTNGNPDLPIYLSRSALVFVLGLFSLK